MLCSIIDKSVNVQLYKTVCFRSCQVAPQFQPKIRVHSKQTRLIVKSTCFAAPKLWQLISIRPMSNGTTLLDHLCFLHQFQTFGASSLRFPGIHAAEGPKSSKSRKLIPLRCRFPRTINAHTHLHTKWPVDIPCNFQRGKAERTVRI